MLDLIIVEPVIIVELDSVKKWRNTKEYRWQNRARVGSLEYVGDGEIIRPVLRLALEQNPSLANATVYVQRNGTNVFNPMPMQKWLSNKWNNQGEQPAWLRKDKS